jgi:hypothetical protein
MIVLMVWPCTTNYNSSSSSSSLAVGVVDLFLEAEQIRFTPPSVTPPGPAAFSSCQAPLTTSPTGHAQYR